MNLFFLISLSILNFNVSDSVEWWTTPNNPQGSVLSTSPFNFFSFTLNIPPLTNWPKQHAHHTQYKDVYPVCQPETPTLLSVLDWVRAEANMHLIWVSKLMP